MEDGRSCGFKRNAPSPTLPRCAGEGVCASARRARCERSFATSVGTAGRVDREIAFRESWARWWKVQRSLPGGFGGDGGRAFVRVEGGLVQTKRPLPYPPPLRGRGSLCEREAGALRTLICHVCGHRWAGGSRDRVSQVGLVGGRCSDRFPAALGVMEAGRSCGSKGGWFKRSAPSPTLPRCAGEGVWVGGWRAHCERSGDPSLRAGRLTL